MVHTTVAAAGTFFNLLLIYIAIFHSPNKIRTYASLILNLAFSDMIICLIDLFVQQRLVPTGWSVIFIGNGPCKYFDYTLCFKANNVGQHLQTFGVYILLVSFSYRYYILALTVQICIPAFCSIAIITYAIGQLRIFNHPALEYASPISLLLTPVVSPLASLYCVHPYKNKVMSLIFKVKVALFKTNMEEG
ncbi:unnamed protein product [Caenorhabditis auriculariae]|uniref:G-protein coupled receptors family 1 profile domain-containing protein n=1 Tax=Caenorhabditis auriculariae TaxID=2777116 RepID=A0A8S1HEC3_9PELO|nr:unnamed protein product [Caenorhabditis auriculariae]